MLDELGPMKIIHILFRVLQTITAGNPSFLKRMKNFLGYLPEREPSMLRMTRKSTQKTLERISIRQMLSQTSYCSISKTVQLMKRIRLNPSSHTLPFLHHIGHYKQRKKIYRNIADFTTMVLKLSASGV